MTNLCHCEDYPKFITDPGPVQAFHASFQGIIVDKEKDLWCVWINGHCYTKDIPCCGNLCVTSVDYDLQNFVLVKDKKTAKVFKIPLGKKVKIR